MSTDTSCTKGLNAQATVTVAPRGGHSPDILGSCTTGSGPVPYYAFTDASFTSSGVLKTENDVDGVVTTDPCGYDISITNPSGTDDIMVQFITNNSIQKMFSLIAVSALSLLFFW